MRKFVFATFALAALVLAIGNVNAAEEKYVAGGFEASGHINTGFGFSYTGSNATTGAGGSVALAGAAGAGRDGWANFQFGNKTKDFGFLLDEVELDLTKTFGENIKFRADIEFTDAALGSANAAFNALEQAYVTANIAAGNGVELLAGRFNAPIGFEAVDRNDNDTITRSSLFNFNLRPRTLTGLKLYYAFTDAVDLHFYVVNNLADRLAAATNFNSDGVLLPSFGFRLGYTWGEKDSESTVGLSGAGGPEAVKAGSKMGYWTYLGDVDFNIWLTEAFALGGEGIFRINAATGAGTTKTTLFGGLVNAHYAFSDVWDGTLKYALLRSNNGSSGIDAVDNPGLTTTKGLLHEISLAGGYTITDGAKFKAEYRVDWTKYTGATKSFAHAVLGQFEYAF